MTEGRWRIIEASNACLACERSCARLWHLSLLDLPGRGHRMWCLALVWRMTQHPRLRPYCRYDSHTRTSSDDKCHAVAPSTGRQPVAMFDVLWQLAMFANVISPISPVVKMLQSYVTHAQSRRLEWLCCGRRYGYFRSEFYMVFHRSSAKLQNLYEGLSASIHKICAVVLHYKIMRETLKARWAP
jgi:hypothetical protein